MLKAGPNSAQARKFLLQLPWRHYNISDLSSSLGHSPSNISFCKSFHRSPRFWACSLMNSCLLKLPSSVCCSPRHRGWWAFTSTAHKHASRPANKLAFHLPPSPVIRRKNVFCISHLKDYRSPTSIFIEGVLFLFRIVNTLCLPGAGYSAVDTVCFSSTHSCNMQVCATGSQNEAKQLLDWEELEVIFSPNEDGFLLNLKPWHKVLQAWGKFASRSNSFANCFGGLNVGRQVIAGRKATKTRTGEALHSKGTAASRHKTRCKAVKDQEVLASPVQDTRQHKISTDKKSGWRRLQTTSTRSFENPRDAEAFTWFGRGQTLIHVEAKDDQTSTWIIPPLIYFVISD